MGLMGFDELKSEALKLAAGHRARLARELLASLEGLAEPDIEQLWLEEAARRDADLDGAKGIPAADVLARARAKLR